MKQINKVSTGENYTAISVGDLDQVAKFSLVHPETKQEIAKGKVFIKEATDATGTEISFSVLPPQGETPFFHTHQQDEETYIILKGEGLYQVDDDCFAITEGSVIRVAPHGKRGMRNTSATEELVYLCIQSQADSVRKYSFADGQMVECPPKWKK